MTIYVFAIVLIAFPTLFAGYRMVQGETHATSDQLAFTAFCWLLALIMFLSQAFSS